ncbi:MAG TPA: ROK family protein [Streptosporangiaceae bacterium]
MSEITTRPATAPLAGAGAGNAPATTIGTTDGTVDDASGGLPPTGDVLAVDVGGTKLAAGIVDMTGRVLRGASRPTPRGGAGAEAVWAALADAVAELGATGVVAVGIGAAGPIDVAAGTVSPVNIPAWRGFPLRDRLGELVPDRPAVLAGDAVAAAMAEYVHGAGRGARGMLGLVVSTGVGGGLVLDGRVHAGPSGNAGHVGHLVVDFAGAACPCGSRGCLETIASGPAMVRWALDNGWSCDMPDGAALALAARAGHPVAVAAFTRGARALAAAITSAVALCEVDRVVIGGSVAKSWGVLAPPLRKALRSYAGMGFVQRAEVVPARLGAAAGLIGAAALARQSAMLGV